MVESTYTDPQGLNDLAKTAWQEKGGKYMGTATDIKQLGDPYYIKVLNDTSDFGVITPTNAMKVCFAYPCLCLLLLLITSARIL
ncbi:hypothetical protein DVH05_020831 [Phytophthora capsici]|nr:hypothetical protein DVH05_020831 [Phytophthora capsici]